ncbi:uncharacterized protein tbc1d10aa [Danio aesculapii]|uniref:uncharacterized protein tbc1d10aa n=1 Tax=Danio aesculapii TaxID=1142201 RepID=UPI0024C03598|nr:uncharacterized protein tbc1d10aa [Danio aesculapii]
MMAQLENGRLSSEDTMSVRTLGSQFDEESSFGSDSEINGFTSSRQTDKYGFIGGAQQYSTEMAQDVPLAVLRHREAKWLDMLNHWDKWISKRFKKVRLRCQKGIPPSLRGRAWLYLSGGKVKREQNVGMFKDLDSMEGDPKWIDVIERDLHRQFPFHEMFVSRGGHGQQDLFRVLKAYTLYRPDEGYCQAQAPIAAVLLMHMPAEDAFWGLVQICEKYLPGYYSAGLEAIQLDGLILNALLKRVSPPAYQHLDKHKIEPILYMTEWFMCAFSRTLPWSSVLRVWDMFLCDGVKIIFRVGLVLLKCMLGTREKLKACPGQYETMELLKALEPRYMQEAFLVHQVMELPISARDVEREHRVQLKRWRKTHGELSYKSPPRMHGAQAIMSAEPHSRQDLRQKPTIVVEYPFPSDTTSNFARVRKRSTIRKASSKLDIPNPYALPTDTKPEGETASNNQSNHPPPSLEQSHLTTPARKTTQSPDPPDSVIPTPSHPSQPPKPRPSPIFSHIPPPPQTSADPRPPHPFEVPHPSKIEPLHNPKDSNNTNNSAHLKDPPHNSNSNPLLIESRPLPPESRQLPPESRQLPPESRQLPPESRQLPPESRQLPPESQQLPPESQQLPPESQQLPPESQQLPPESQQLPLESEQLPPEARQLPPESPPIPPESPPIPPELKHLPPEPGHLPPEPGHLPPEPEHLLPEPKQHHPESTQLPSESRALTPESRPLTPGSRPLPAESRQFTPEPIPLPEPRQLPPESRQLPSQSRLLPPDSSLFPLPPEFNPLPPEFSPLPPGFSPLPLPPDFSPLPLPPDFSPLPLPPDFSPLPLPPEFSPLPPDFIPPLPESSPLPPVSSSLLSSDAPVNGDLAAAPKVLSLRNSCESVGSEDTYL